MRLFSRKIDTGAGRRATPSSTSYICKNGRSPERYVAADCYSTSPGNPGWTRVAKVELVFHSSVLTGSELTETFPQQRLPRTQYCDSGNGTNAESRSRPHRQRNCDQSCEYWKKKARTRLWLGQLFFRL